MPRQYIRGTISERIDAYTDRSPGADACWPWLGAKDKDGYPFVSTGTSRCSRAIPVIYRMLVGPIPPSHEVRHICDTPMCVNPRHLITGTHQENVRDCTSQGRQAKGSGKPRAKLHESDIPTIRSRLAAGETCSAVAETYGVSQPVISNIKNGKAWKHV